MENKKNLGIYIYKILKEESDENHRLQFNDIISILKDKYGMTLDEALQLYDQKDRDEYTIVIYKKLAQLARNMEKRQHRG